MPEYIQRRGYEIIFNKILSYLLIVLLSFHLVRQHIGFELYCEYLEKIKGVYINE